MAFTGSIHNKPIYDLMIYYFAGAKIQKNEE
jgi:hypothetical protein